MATNRIKKIKLTDGSVYAIFDEGALHYGDAYLSLSDSIAPAEGETPAVGTKGGRILLYTGNPVVDDIILKGGLEIDEVDDVPVSELNPEVVFRDPTTGRLEKLSLEQAQVKLGIKRYALKQANGVLSLGAQDISGGTITDATFI